MAHFVSHDAAENFRKINPPFHMKVLRSFPEHIAVPAGSVGGQEGDAEGCVVG